MWLFGKKKHNDLLEVIAPHAGTIDILTSLEDQIFSKKMMGDGLVITPPRGAQIIDVLAPINGKLVTVFPTKQAFGIKAKEGKEILVHIGVNTASLKGKGFKTFITQNRMVKAGTKLATVDLDFVRKNAPLASTIIIATSGEEIKKPATGKVEALAPLFKI